ncbi:GNAT family N-acetyltransferase [Streptomyces albireticuli]|uniref:Histone acetyltransferase n=1 Tax=Streptomyces albireticuli TaxID=1940 RepID=A0A2A2D3C8_9ACTN|nr:GNAT family N-acetyltransferase [Streptomyces albireticuli]PAU45909.1 histone acetyltransferase [Streptomyces albireticuli]
MPAPAPAPALRRAAAPDAEAAAEVWLRSYDAALPTVRRAHSDDEVRAFFRHVVIPERETWVAEAESREGDGGIVGVMVLTEAESESESESEAESEARTEGAAGAGHVDQLYLAPAWRGRGLGDRFLSLAKERFPAGLELWTFQINTPAHRFYERHGFTAAERTDGSGNEEREPDVRYVWLPRSR